MYVSPLMAVVYVYVVPDTEPFDHCELNILEKPSEKPVR